MDLKKTIRKVLKEMIIEESSQKPQDIIKANIIKILNTLKSDASKQSKGVINAQSAIDKFGNHLISQIPSILEKSKTGRGGEQFAYECYNKISQILDEELNSISGIKKFTLRQFAPKKDEFMKFSLNPNHYDLYFYFFEQLIDFPFQVGYLPEFEKVSDNMASFSSQITNYLDKNRIKIINYFVNKVANFLYK